MPRVPEKRFQKCDCCSLLEREGQFRCSGRWSFAGLRLREQLQGRAQIFRPQAMRPRPRAPSQNHFEIHGNGVLWIVNCHRVEGSECDLSRSGACTDFQQNQRRMQAFC